MTASKPKTEESFLAGIFDVVLPKEAPLPAAVIKHREGWDNLGRNYRKRCQRVRHLCSGGSKIVEMGKAIELLEGVLEPFDRVAIEGDNQKQADFLARTLVKVDPGKIHDLHMVQSVIALPEHVEIFEKGIARKVDFSYSGPQAARLSALLESGKIEIGSIHTYLELYARYFIDLTPQVALVAADYADRHGNLYTGYSTEDTPVLCEATKFRNGIVIAQVNGIKDRLPRVDIQSDWIDFIIQADKPYHMEPLFTRDPAAITETQILIAMLCLKGIYAPYQVQSLNHGVGFNTAAIELLLPTYGEQLGLKGKICSNFILNPHPTMIPAIEAGWVKSIHSPGGELGMENYVRARPDIFFVGPDGNMRSNRAYAQMAGLYGIDMFIGSTLQIDQYGNSSTATAQRITGFGGAPNIGGDPPGRRHATGAWMKAGAEYAFQQQLIGPMPRGKKLVVQAVETFAEGMRPTFVEELDAWKLAEKYGFPQPPVMIYADNITHLVTEAGIAQLHKCGSLAERSAAIKAVAGYTPLGITASAKMTEQLRKTGIVQTPEDLGIDPTQAVRSLLAAQNIRDLVEISRGLYEPPVRFRNW